MRRAPSVFGHSQCRWTLDSIARTCDWLVVTTAAGVSQILDRLGIHYKRARSYVHSPDPYYAEKYALIQQCLLRAWYDPEHYVFLYQDEFTYNRQPTLARAYAEKGPSQALARLSYCSNCQFRGIAALNAITGQVTYQQSAKIDLRQLTTFYDTVRVTYPEARQIYIAQDNWPVHFHPDVLARLQPQHFPWPPKIPPNWPAAPSEKVVKANLPIQILCLPTYASWLNPIEKLWRWVRQDVLHLHRLSDDWQALKQQVADFLAQFNKPSTALLGYVGLLPD